MIADEDDSPYNFNWQIVNEVVIYRGKLSSLDNVAAYVLPTDASFTSSSLMIKIYIFYG